MRENSRRGAPRSARAKDRTVAGRDARGRGPGVQGGGRPGQNGQVGGQPGRASRQPGQAGRDGVHAATDTARLTRLLEPVLAALDMDLEAVRLSSAGRRRVLRIVVDADGGVSLDDIAEVSREVSASLDAGNAMGDAPYTLEVSSPGIDRPLTEPRHWRRAVGRLVAISLMADGHDQKRDADDRPRALNGRVVAADQNSATLEVDGVSRTFGYPELGPGRVQVEFGRLDEADETDEADDFDLAAAGEPDDRREADETDTYFTRADSAAGEGADEEEPRGH
jgi:ribosome maturation factor RimP